MSGTELGERDDRVLSEVVRPLPSPMIASVPAAAPTVVVAARNERGDVLLVRRLGEAGWELPGGRVDAAGALGRVGVRATVEETGVWVRVTGLVGLFSEPGAEGCPGRPFVICLHAWAVAGEPRPDLLGREVARWFAPDAVPDLELEPGAARWIRYALSGAAEPHLD